MGQRGSRPQPETRVLLLGLDSAGKSTLLYKLKYNESVDTVPTIGFNVEMIEAKKRRERVALTVWDVGGQKTMRHYWKSFYQDTAGLVFVVDSSDRRRLDEARRELDHALRSEFLRGLPVVILANKQDLPEAVSVTEITERFNLKKMCAERDWFVQPCSAVTGAGLVEGFQKVANLLKLPSEDVQDNIKETVQYLRSKSVKSMGL
ncbi:ADP-ribosylation factor-like protein 14 [Coregonus clupeaformis]|uniref:ADP-ribosylation factor-like protein 14 n=1 Tax=Coregonus clupeaformis TaxID=59861 RepID=UPI001E1C3697|nr:ADP-ribosylation factor-like protein 14 [Coregonus clupeaformis]